jgi:PKD repeat protein
LASKGSTTIPFTWDTTDVDSGTYTITAEAILAKDEDPNNNKASTTITVKLELILLPPVAKITENATTALTGEVIRFDASESYDPDGGDIVEYFWSFGDGTTASGVTVDHSYADDGTYIVTLTITDDEGSTASATATKIIGNRLPVALFAQSVLTVKTGRPTTFNASDSYDLDGTIVSYEWGFGDGIVVTETDPITSHVYDDDGVYTVTLTVTDDDGATNSTSITKTILNRLPTASFTQNATTINVGEAIRFDASHSFDPDGDIVEYFWDFGDGTNDTGMTVDHVYTEGGNYTVTLTVTDDDGSTATESSEIVVKALAVPWALYAAVALGIIAAAATVIYLWYRRRKRKKAATTASTKPSTKPTVTLYLPANILAEPDKSSQSG